MHESQNLCEKKLNDLSSLNSKLHEIIDKKQNKEGCEFDKVVKGTMCDSDGKQLNMRFFQFTKSYLVLQEVTKNDATLIPPKLLDYLVEMSSTYTYTPLGCTMRESTDYIIRELFRRLQTGQVWVALKVFYVFYQLVWRGSRSIIESTRALDKPFFCIDTILERIKQTPQENITGDPLPCTLPCGTRCDNRVCNGDPLNQSDVVKGPAHRTISKCGTSVGRVAGCAMMNILPKCCKGSSNANNNANSKEDFWLYSTNVEYLRKCVSLEFTYNCIGHISALCEYCYQHPDVDLANGHLTPSFIKNARISELKILYEDTLELLQSTATLDMNVPVGCVLARAMLSKRLSDARVLYFICCHALLLFLEASITKVIRILDDYNTGSDSSQPSHTTEDGKLCKYIISLVMNSNTSTSAGPQPKNVESNMHTSTDYNEYGILGLLKDWYNILHQLDRTVRMLHNVCETVQEDNSEALALLNYTNRIPKEVLDRMNVLSRVSHEKLPCNQDDEGELLSMVESSDQSFSATRVGFEHQATMGDSRSSVNMSVGNSAGTTNTSGLGTDFKFWKDRLSYARTSWEIQIKSLRGLLKEDTCITQLLNVLEKKLIYYFNVIETMSARPQKIPPSSGSVLTHWTASEQTRISDSGTDKLGTITTPLIPLDDLRLSKGSSDLWHLNFLIARRVTLEGPQVGDVNKQAISPVNSNREGVPSERDGVGTMNLHLSRSYHIHSRGSELTTSTNETFVEHEGVNAESCMPGLDMMPLTDDMMETNASIQSLLERDDIVVVCNEPFTANHQGSMAERFHIIRGRAPIGEGSYSSVYRAWDELIGRYLAAKEVTLDAKRLPAVVRGVLKEYMVLTSLRHPNIVNVVAFMIDGNSCKIFMEWMPSGSLRDVLLDNRFGTLRESVVSRYIRDTLLGLDFLHSRGVLHRDIKPANMLLGTEGAVKLTDFGTSVLLSENEHTLKSGVIMGTAPYMAPEAVRGVYSAASDVWSLGCTALELATGHVPWEDLNMGTRLNPVQLIYKIGKLNDNDDGNNMPHSYLRAAQSENGGAVPLPEQKPAVSVSEDLLSFLDRIFVLDRHARATTTELLKHPFITKHHEAWKLRQMELEMAVNRPGTDS